MSKGETGQVNVEMVEVGLFSGGKRKMHKNESNASLYGQSGRKGFGSNFAEGRPGGRG